MLKNYRTKYSLIVYHYEIRSIKKKRKRNNFVDKFRKEVTKRLNIKMNFTVIKS